MVRDSSSGDDAVRRLAAVMIAMTMTPGSEIRTLGPRAKEWTPCRLASSHGRMRIICARRAHSRAPPLPVIFFVARTRAWDSKKIHQLGPDFP
jgi:hypothetical protein